MRPMPELRVTTVKVADLTPYAGNAKIHTHEQIDQIAESIERFGNNDPIAVWHNADGEMEIVEGHGRLQALKKLGAEECPVIMLDHLDDEQRRAYTIVHNQLTLNSDFDLDVLQAELAKLESVDVSFAGFDLESAERDLAGLEVGEAFERAVEEAEMVVCPRCGHAQRR